MQGLDITVTYDIAAEGKGPWGEWLRGRLDERIRERLTDGVEEFEVVPGSVTASYEGPANSAEAGSMLLRFEHYSVEDADYDAEDDDDPAVDSDFIAECVREGLDAIVDAAGWSGMRISLEAADSVARRSLLEG